MGVIQITCNQLLPSTDCNVLPSEYVHTEYVLFSAVNIQHDLQRRPEKPSG